MCGICGVVQFNGLNPDSDLVVRKMADKLLHRGPDDFGYYGDALCAFGFRRLSIIDLKTGHQPIANEDETIWIVFNGEIYNFQELRARLEKSGHHFRTRTDTEVIVHAYEEYGVDCLKYFRGMFAIAIWDRTNQRIFLARDRLGKKPLYYYYSNERIVFASELKSIVQFPGVPRDIDLNSLNIYLTYGYIQPPHSIFKGINKLSPGSYLELSLPERRLVVDRYWKLNFEPKENITEESAQSQVRQTVEEAVRLRMISDVPLGVMLSGGIDSTIVTGIMSKASTQPIKTFSIGFDELDYNELPFARLVAERFKTDHHELIVRPKIAEIIPEVVYYLDEPMDDSSAIPTYLVARMARQHVTVALNGDGADESFSGYSRYGDILRSLQTANFLPRKLNKVLATIFEWIPRNVDVGRLAARTRTLLEINHLSLGEFVLRNYQRWSCVERQSLFRPEIWKDLNGEGPLFPEKILHDYFQTYLSTDAIDQMLAIDTEMYLPGDLLVKMDRMSMGNSLEARSPFLDQEVIALAARLPGDMKRRGRNGKIILKKAFSDLIPAPILTRPKHGFRIPLGLWLKNDLKNMLNDILLSKNAHSLEYFERESISNLLSDHQSGIQNFHSKIWNLLVLELWQQQINL